MSLVLRASPDSISFSSVSRPFLSHLRNRAFAPSKTRTRVSGVSMAMVHSLVLCARQHRPLDSGSFASAQRLLLCRICEERGARMAEFTGFPKTFFAFFRELKANNDRAWFEANKSRFRETVQAPMSDFIEAMAPHLSRISKEFVADPRPNGGSMFRIYRDVRFSRDKRPYKEHGACQFRHRLGRDVHAPGFYVHLAPKEVF